MNHRLGFANRASFGRFLSSALFALPALSAFAQAPTITAPPLSKIATVGQSVSFTVGAAGAGPLTYQWNHNGQVLAGATAATFAVTNATLADSGWYRVTVSNEWDAVSSVALLQVGASNSAVISLGTNQVPSGVSDPIAIGASYWTGLALQANGDLMTWDPTVAGGAAILAARGVVGMSTSSSGSFAVKADGTVLGWGPSGGGDVVLPPDSTNIVAASAGRFGFLFLKADGTVVQSAAYPFMPSPPPADLRDVVGIAMGERSALALKADGTVVEWGNSGNFALGGLANVIAIAGERQFLALRSDGTVVGWDEDSGALVEPPAGLNQVVAIAPGYLALKSDGTVVGWGDYASLPAGLSNVVGIGGGYALAQKTLPAISVQPVGHPTTVGDYVTLTVAATGTIPLSYQWKRNGTSLANDGRISGATTATLALDGIASADAGSYTVEVSNSSGVAISTAVMLTVNVPPTITVRPHTRLVTVGDAVTCTVTATDPGPISYQWKRNGQPIAGATSATLTLPSVTLVDRGFYEVVVNNSTATATSVFAVQVSSSPTTGIVVVPWGNSFNDYGQTRIPVGLSNVVAVAAGANHAVALKSDGTVTAWGLSAYGATAVPAGLADVVAVAAGDYFTLALKADGRVVSWGSNGSTPLPIPVGLRDVVAISARSSNVSALKSDGTVVAWGSTPPAGLNGVVAIAAGDSFNLALKSDATVVAWGPTGTYGQTSIPADLSGVVAIAAGGDHGLALKNDGTVVAWGRNDIGQAAVPAGLNGVVAIDGGFVHSIALRADGTVVGWGRDNEGQVSYTARWGGVAAISAGAYYNLALVAAGAPTISLQPASRTVNAGENAKLA